MAFIALGSHVHDAHFVYTHMQYTVMFVCLSDCLLYVHGKKAEVNYPNQTVPGKASKNQFSNTSRTFLLLESAESGVAVNRQSLPTEPARPVIVL